MRKMSVQLVCNYDIPVKMGYQSFSDICIPQEVLTELQQKDLEGAYQTTLNYLNNGDIDPATYVNCAGKHIQKRRDQTANRILLKY
jgi:hypothetical protein